MLADNLENILKVIGVNELPHEVVSDNSVYMNFPKDMFRFFQEGVENIAFLYNSVRKMNGQKIVCELREFVNNEWCMTLLTIEKGEYCVVELKIVGRDVYTPEGGYKTIGR